MNEINIKTTDATATTAWQNEVETASKLAKKGWLSNPTRSPEQIKNAQKSFENYFENEMLKMGLPSKSKDTGIQKLRKEAKDILDNICHSTFQAVKASRKPVDENHFRIKVLVANTTAKLQLMKLREKASHLPVVQIIPKQDSHGKDPEGYLVMRPAPKIQNLAMAGGGAKGIGYAPAMEALGKAGFMKSLEHISGSSVGALASSLLASGQDAKCLSELSAKFGSFASGEIDWSGDYSKKYADISWPVDVGFKAWKAIELVDRRSMEPVQEFLKSLGDDFEKLPQHPKLDDTQKKRLKELRECDLEQPRKGKMLTFSDLALLHQLNPEKFKKLTITGFEKSTGKTHYFSAASHPDLPVAYAARASMAFPVVFKPIVINGKTFSDGGIGSNLPSQVFKSDGKSDPLLNAKTMVMSFDESGKGYQILHGNRKGLKTTSPYPLKSLVSGNWNFAERTTNDRQNLHDAGPNGFVVFHGDVGCMDLGVGKGVQLNPHAAPSEVRKKFATIISSMKTVEYLEMRQDQAISKDYDSIDKIVDSLSEREKEWIQGLGEDELKKYGLTEVRGRLDEINKCFKDSQCIIL